MTSQILFNNRPYEDLDPAKLTRKHLADSMTDALAAMGYAQPMFIAYSLDRQRMHCLWPHDPLAAHIPTAATDGKTIWLNAAYFATLTVAKACGVIAHEISHDFLGHPAKSKYWQEMGFVRSADGSKDMPYNALLVNIAMDAEINPMLLQDHMQLPDSRVEFDWVKPGAMAVEEIYEKLLKDQPPQPEPEEGDDEGSANGEGDDQNEKDEEKTGDGSSQEKGSGGEDGDDADASGDGGSGQDPTPQPSHGNFDQHIIPTDPRVGSDADAEDRRRALKQAIATAKVAGKLPGHYEALVDKLLAPSVDWRRELVDAIEQTIGYDQNDPARFNRKTFLMTGALAPRRRSERCGPVVFVFDTSSSMGPYLQQAISEVAAVVRDMQPASVHILWTDAIVQHVDDLEDAEDRDIAGLTMHGGGGTDLTTGFDWVEDELISEGEFPAAVVVLTDSYTPWPDEEPPYPTIIATTDTSERLNPSWARVVAMDNTTG